MGRHEDCCLFSETELADLLDKIMIEKRVVYDLKSGRRKVRAIYD